MITKMGTLKQFCIENFESDNGILVFKFFNKMKCNGNSKNKLSVRKINFIKILIDDFSKEAIIESLYIWQKNEEEGLIDRYSGHGLSYFRGICKNTYEKRKDKGFLSKEQLTQKYEKITQQSPVFDTCWVHPVKGAKIYEGYGEGDNPLSYNHNFNYKCSTDGCEGEFDRWTNKCPICQNLITWENIK